jgi:DNA polymerase-3 subunit delta
VSGPARPAYLVRGPDPALVEQAAHELVHRLLGPEPAQLALEEFDAESAESQALAAALATPPMLCARRVVVVRQAGRLGPDGAALLARWLEDPPEANCLVLVGGGGSMPAGLLEAVRRRGEVVDTAVGPGGGRAGWVGGRVRGPPVRLDSEAAALLDAHVGEDLWRLAGVLDALAAAYGEGSRLGRAELEPFLGQAGSLAPWELTDAIDRGDTAGALSALSRLTGAGGRHPLVVMASLHAHYSSMLRLDGAQVATAEEAAALLGSRSSFAAGKLLAQSRRLGTARLARAIRLLARADWDLRGATAWPAGLVLEVLVARLSRLAPARSRPQGRQARPRGV